MKKILSKIALLLCCVPIICGMTGCFIGGLKAEDYLPEFENEIYKYAVRTDSNGYKQCYIVGLTELGQSKTELIFPEKIDGMPVRGLGYARYANPLFNKYEPVVHFESENLLKVYVPFDTKKVSWYTHYTMCPNAYFVIWKSHNFMSFGQGWIRGYNLTSEYFVQSTDDILANVSYMYNYENALNDGYYWVDNYNEDLISFIPPEPTRVGYTFNGWYKEKECINAWDFETDKTGKQIEYGSSNFNDNNVDKITFLYAKWIKN